MLRTLVGEAGFRRGTDVYFQRHDGQAVTTRIFCAPSRMPMRCSCSNSALVHAGRHASCAGGAALQPRNAHLCADVHANVSGHTGQPDKLPFHIPVAMALLGAMDRNCRYAYLASMRRRRVRVFCKCVRRRTRSCSRISIANRCRPCCAFLRTDSSGFDYSHAELSFLLAHDRILLSLGGRSALAVQLLLTLTQSVQTGIALVVPDDFVSAVHAVLMAQDMDPAFRALARRSRVKPISGVHDRDRSASHPCRAAALTPASGACAA